MPPIQYILMLQFSLKKHKSINISDLNKTTGFSQLRSLDRVCMIKNSVYPLWLIFHSSNYNLQDQEYNWFTSTHKERDLIMAYIRPLTLLVNHFRYHFKHFFYIFFKLCSMIFVLDRYGY